MLLGEPESDSEDTNLARIFVWTTVLCEKFYEKKTTYARDFFSRFICKPFLDLSHYSKFSSKFFYFIFYFIFIIIVFFFSKTNTNEDPFLCAKCVIPKTNHLDHGIPLCEKCATDSIVTRLYCTSVRILCSIFNNLDTETTYAILLGQFFQTFSVCRWPFRSLLGSCSGVLSFFLYDLDIDRS